MAAAFLFTACSGENDLAEEPTTQQPAAQTATKIHVTVGAGISDGDGQTRATVTETQYEDDYGQKKTRRTLTFTLPVGEPGDADYSPGDRLYVWGEITEDERTMGGLLTATSISDDGKSATFEGDLTVWVKDGGDWEEDKSGWASTQSGDPMTWYGTNTIEGTLIPAATAANAQIYSYDDNGHIYRFNHEYSLVSGDGDLANKLMESAIHVCGYYSNSDQRFNLVCGDAIFNCTVSGLGINTPYYLRFGYAFSEADYNSNGPIECYTYAQPVTTDGNGTARFAIGTDKVVNGYWGFYLCTADDFYREDHEFFDCLIGQIDPIYPKVYNVKRNWTGTAFVAPQTYNLASVTSDLTLRNGDVVTGELSGNHKISIADGATVTLRGATIPGRDVTDDSQLQWAGITCLGDATIVLAEGTENYAKGYDRGYPGIQAGPAGTTLTIRGAGKLTAVAAMGTYNGEAAGIGGGKNQTVGNIRIEGGTIIAQANYGGAGIGSGYAYDATASCGDITITGGSVTATGGGKGAGIGSGYSDRSDASCGNITITGGNVTAKGGNRAAGIGSGCNIDQYNSCGDITIGGTAKVSVMGGEDSPNDIGAGNGSRCGEVNVQNGTIIGMYTCSFTVKYYQTMSGSNESGFMSTPAYSVSASEILVTRGGRTYTAIGTFTNDSEVTFNMNVMPGDVITVTSPGADYYTSDFIAGGPKSTATFSGTLSVPAITLDESTTNYLGTVNLVKQ